MGDERILHHGRVINLHGAGLANAMVYVARGTAPTPEIAVVCDDDGNFRLALPPGHFVVEARSADGHVGSAEVDVATTAETISIIVEE